MVCFQTLPMTFWLVLTTPVWLLALVHELPSILLRVALTFLMVSNHDVHLHQALMAATFQSQPVGPADVGTAGSFQSPHQGDATSLKSCHHVIEWLCTCLPNALE